MIADGKADSITIANQRKAYAELETAVSACKKAVDAAGVKSDRQAALLIIAEDRLKRKDKIIRTQKFVKWSGWGVAAFLLYLVAKQAAN